MPVEILVNRAMPYDAALLAALHASCFARAWDEAAMAQFIGAPDTLCLIASALDGVQCAPAGFLIARKAADEAELLTLGVAPATRRIGLGTRLARTSVRDLAGKRGQPALSRSGRGKRGGAALYRSLGAVEVGRRPRYYEHGADAAIFSLALSTGPADDDAALARRQA